MDMCLRKHPGLGGQGLQFRQFTAFSRSLQFHAHTSWFPFFLVDRLAHASFELNLATVPGGSYRDLVGSL